MKHLVENIHFSLREYLHLSMEQPSAFPLFFSYLEYQILHNVLKINSALKHQNLTNLLQDKEGYSYDNQFISFNFENLRILFHRSKTILFYFSD